MANFFELLGFTSDEMADTMPEKIVQAFHDRGKDGVRELMYQEMAKRLHSPLHIYITNDDGVVSDTCNEYGSDQPGGPIKLIREVTDLYRKWGEPPGSSSPDRGSPDAGGGGVPRKPKSRPAGGGGGARGGGGGGDGKNTGPEAWEKRFADLADFVNKNGFRPRRTAPTDAERHLHYWMGQQQRKLGHNELTREQGDKLEALLLATKGKKADGGGGGGARKPGGGSSSRRSHTSHSETAGGGGDDDGDDGDYE